jgi:hypothetical protein
VKTFPKHTILQIPQQKLTARVFKSGEVGGHENPSSTSTRYWLILVRQDTPPENVMMKENYCIAGVRSGTILFKPAELNGMPNPKRKGTNSSLSRLK